MVGARRDGSGEERWYWLGEMVGAGRDRRGEGVGAGRDGRGEDRW